MNERIKELAEQARKHFPKTESSGEFWMFDEQKFAELIIQECARVARATPAPNFHEHLKQQLGHTWDMACVESGRQIVEHFGVEE